MNTIECPKCQTKIEINKAMTAQLTDTIRQELQAGVDAEKAAVAKEAEKVARQQAANEKAAAEIELKVKSGIESGVGAARAAIVADARRKAQEDLAVELRDGAARVSELEGKLKTYQATELALRKRERELEDKAASLDLEVARQVKDAAGQAREAARKQAAEEHELKDKEKDERLASMVRQIDEMKRKAEQGSQQSQGEALELVLEDVLTRTFPFDAVEAVAKGVHGADILQRVQEAGQECGAILWETKNAKKWSQAWLSKLREDQREAKAAVAVLVTEAMPLGVGNFTQIDGVWVCDRACAMGLGMALRAGLIELAQSRRAAEGRQGKTERAYHYLTGSEFRQRVEGVVEPLLRLQEGLNRERRAMERIWSAREKEIAAAVLGMHGMYGDLQGIIGSTLPTLEAMDLPRLAAGEEEPEPVSGGRGGEAGGE